MNWLCVVFPLVAVIYFMIRDLPNTRQQIKKRASDSLVALLRCPQTGQPLVTDLNISVSDDMRRQLYWPLTHDIVHTIATTDVPPQESRFLYRCTDCQIGSKVITGTVDIIIDYSNVTNGLDLHYHFVPVKLRLELAGPDKGWTLTDVSHPQVG